MSDINNNINREFLGNIPLYANSRKVIFGEKINEFPCSINNLNIEDGIITVWGDVRHVTERKSKSGESEVLLFDITDYTSSVTIKMFDKKSIVQSVAESVESVKTVIVYGEYKYDFMLNDMVIKPISIESVVKCEKEDTCSEKRIELHLHTSFSEMDGINSPVDYINRAKEWGHKAIAITDHGVVQGLPSAYRAAKDAGIKLILGMEGYLVDDEKYPDFMNMKLRNFKRHHVIILIKEDTSFDENIPKENRVYGRRNLYELISYSYTKTYKSRPLIPKSLLAQKRKGLLIGSACEQGELYQAVLCNEGQEELERIAAFYDYIEIQPNCNNEFMIDSKSEIHKNIHNEKDLIQINKRIIEIADKLKKPVVATGDAHFLDKNDAKFRAIIMHAKGFEYNMVQPDLCFKSTDEMLDEFDWAGDRAKEFVIDNPNRIADMIMDDVRPVPNEYFPFDLEKANEELKEVCEKRVRELYGENLPSQIRKRVDRELELLMNFNFSTYYVLAMRIVEDSKKHGYTVGTRGSVGASFAAYLCGITNINPLEPHYYCPDCHYTEFITDGSVASGFDLPEKKCPHCNAPLKRDGHEIPYETFLGFDGDKEPDIDLNLSSEYQECAHKFMYKLFGENRVFYAGTIATVADKTAHRYVMEYLEKQGIKDSVSDDEIERLVSGCTGVKRTTGVHPGGVLVLPKGCVIEDFTPVQYFCNDPSTEKLKTHYSYRNSDLDFHLTKFDLLGHDIPTMLKHLEELTGVKAEDIDISAPELYELLTSCKPLGVNPEDIKCETGTLAINELGTEFMTNLLMLTKPKNFSELVKVSGLSHGTNTWKNNAENFVESDSFDFKTVPACRDDIFVYLMHKCKEYENKTGRKSPLSRLECFKIMEFTRKGKADRFLAELEDKMQAISVDYSYIRSLKKIRYMFPKAHTVSYVIWALQLLWYKLYYPQEFYASYFTVQDISIDNFEYIESKDSVKGKMNEIFNKGKIKSYREENIYYYLQITNEMIVRGIEFLPVDIYKSDATNYKVECNKIRLPLTAINCIKENTANAIVHARNDGEGEFTSCNNLKDRAGINKNIVEALKKANALNNMPDCDQISLL